VRLPRPESRVEQVVASVKHGSCPITSDPTPWVSEVVQEVSDALRAAQMRERAAFDRSLRAREDFEATRRALLSRTEAADQSAKHAEERCAAVKNTYNLYEFYLRNLRRKLEAEGKELSF
jgi:hypothetical protein